MKTVKTEAGKLLLVKIPEDAYDFNISYIQSRNGHDVLLKYFYANDSMSFLKVINYDVTSKYKIIGKFSELGDKDFEEFVINTVRCNNCYWEDCEENLQIFTDLSSDIVGKEIQYFKGCPNCKTDNYLTDIAKESFQSLCKSQGIEDKLDNYLIIKKT
jgi:hypothetical protein